VAGLRRRYHWPTDRLDIGADAGVFGVVDRVPLETVLPSGRAVGTVHRLEPAPGLGYQ